MRWAIILICIFYYTNPLQAQDNDNGYTDRIALTIPASQTHTTTDIAGYIKAHFDTDNKRIRAIYTWVTNNIKYDKDSIHRVILDEDNEERVTYALKRRKGVCENFAAIFTDICTKAGINSYMIEGYTRQSGSIDRSPHVWCAAFINNQWFLYDPTWDAGFISRGFYVNQAQTHYFQMNPNDFIDTHLPFDPLFQFLNYPISYREFYRGSKQTLPTGRHANKSDSYFNYMDSISVYEKSDTLSKYLSALSRIRNFDWPASKIDIKIKRIKLEIELIYQDKDMALYHSAIADYNKGIGILNEFINYRNNQFQPVKTVDEVQGMFNSISQKISSANQKLEEVNKSKATLTLNTGGIQEKLDELVSTLKEEQSFFKKYLGSSK